MADFESEYTINFTWQGDLNLPEVSSVEIILAPARSVWDDHFDENDYSNHTVSHGLHKMENGMFTADIPLRINIYHFLFRINNCAHDLAPSWKHNTTSLANGRKLNYINVGDPLSIIQLNHPEIEDQSKSALPRQGDERTPLLSSSSRPRVKGIKRFFLCCCLD